jgi:hypothetical protein
MTEGTFVRILVLQVNCEHAWVNMNTESTTTTHT